MDWGVVSKDLDGPLDPRNVIKPSGSFGPKGDYIEGWFAIEEANRIFGFENWSYTTDLQKVSEFVNDKGNTEISYICRCSLTVDGVTRQDVGYGSGAAKKPGDAYEGAVKEAVTDSLKRSLRTFGNKFGLALYDKTKANVRVEEPPFDQRKVADALIAAFKKCEKMDEVAAQWGAGKANIARLKDEKPPMFNEVVKAKDDAKARLSGDFVNTFGNETKEKDAV